MARVANGPHVRLLRDTSGSSVTEYGLIAGGIALVGILAALTAGVEVRELFGGTSEIIADNVEMPETPSSPAPPPEPAGPAPMVLTYEVTGLNPMLGTQSALFLGFDGDITLDCGQGTEPLDIVEPGFFSAACTYSAPGTYTIEVSGRLANLGWDLSGGTIGTIQFAYYDVNTDSIVFDTGSFSDPLHMPFLARVESFGDIGLVGLNGAFASNDVLEYVAPLPPTVDSLRNMMAGSTANPTGLETWNTSNVVNLRGTFAFASNFDRDISGWDTSSVITFEKTFQEADSFNRDISGWDTSAGEFFRGMFASADLFNQPVSDIGGWNMSSASDVSAMFANADSFNQSGEGWVGIPATNFSDMFHDADAFNGDVERWQMFNADNTRFMFADADSFDQDLSQWDMSAATVTTGMFAASPFDNAGQPLTWDIGSALGAEYMFADTSFSQDTSGWCVTNLTVPQSGFFRNVATPPPSPIWGTCP